MKQPSPDGEDNRFEMMAEGLKAPEAQSFVEFYEDFQPRFRAIYLRMGLPEYAATDLATEVCSDICLSVDVYLRSSQVTGKRNFCAWAFRVARNKGIDWLRREKRQVKTQPFDELLEHAVAEREMVKGSGRRPNDLAEPITSDNEDREATFSQLQQALQRAFTQLSDTERDVILLRYFLGGDSFAEIARQLGKTVSNVRVIHLRAKEKLAQLLQRDIRVRVMLKLDQGKGGSNEQ